MLKSIKICVRKNKTKDAKAEAWSMFRLRKKNIKNLRRTVLRRFLVTSSKLQVISSKSTPTVNPRARETEKIWKMENGEGNRLIPLPYGLSMHAVEHVHGPVIVQVIFPPAVVTKLEW